MLVFGVQICIIKDQTQCYISLKLKFKRGGSGMYALISGISDTDYINFCPKCGEPIRTHCGDGTAKCDDCGFHFGVVECSDD